MKYVELFVGHSTMACVLLILIVIGCSPPSDAEKLPERIPATSIEGNLIDIKYSDHNGWIILFFEDGRELRLSSTTDGSWTHPLKRGYVKIEHSFGSVKNISESDEEEWKEIR